MLRRRATTRVVTGRGGLRTLPARLHSAADEHHGALDPHHLVAREFPLDARRAERAQRQAPRFAPETTERRPPSARPDPPRRSRRRETPVPWRRPPPAPRTCRDRASFRRRSGPHLGAGIRAAMVGLTVPGGRHPERGQLRRCPPSHSIGLGPVPRPQWRRSRISSSTAASPRSGLGRPLEART